VKEHPLFPGKEQELFGIVSLFGHQKIAGRFSEYSLGGTFLRVDVPAVNGNVGFTKLIGYGAVFDISFVDKRVADACAGEINLSPIQGFSAKELVAKVCLERITAKHEREDEIPF